MKKFLPVLILILLFSSISLINAQDEEAFTCPEGESIDLVVAAGAVGIELDLTNVIFDRFMEDCPNVRVRALESPSLVTNRLGLYIQFLGTRSEAVDVYQIDVTWPSILAEHMVDLYEYAPADSEIIQQHFAPIVANNTVDGKLVGMPWFTDVGLLYYRTDLLEKYELELPTTWGDLEEAARVIQEGERAEGNDEFWGYVWQGNIGEPTTINALEWQSSSGGGVIVNPEGEIEVNNRAAIEAIERAANWIGVISPEEVTGHAPEDSRAIWQAGNAAFMRNWPYAYNLGNASDSPIAGSFEVAALPAGEGDEAKRTGVLGGWQLAVSSYSRNPDAAAALVLYMTSYDSQKLRAIEGSLIPTIQSLYEDEEVLNTVPILASMFEAVTNATARPSTIAGTRYNDVTRLYSNAVYSVLRGEEDARTALEDLEFDLEDLFSVPAQVVQPTLDPDLAEEIEAVSTVEDDDTAETEETTETETEVTTEETEPETTETEEESSDDNQMLLIAGAVIAVIVVLGGGFLFSRRSR